MTHVLNTLIGDGRECNECDTPMEITESEDAVFYQCSRCGHEAPLPTTLHLQVATWHDSV